MTDFNNVPEDIKRYIVSFLPSEEIKKTIYALSISKKKPELKDIYLEKKKEEDIRQNANNLYLIIHTTMYDFLWNWELRKFTELKNKTGGEISKEIGDVWGKTIKKYLILQYRVKHRESYKTKSIEKWKNSKNKIRNHMVNILENALPELIKRYNIKF